MLFNSLAFLIFFPAVTLLFFILPHKVRWAWLLAASCFFYMFFKPEYILILGFTIVIDYYAGILLHGQQDPRKRKRYLMMSLAANIGVLALFKYYNFLNTNITGVAALFHMGNTLPVLRMALPIGLSFHTFQAMSYTIEVYRGKQAPERHFGIYALYVMFYPQLVAGPIERPQNMLHQFHERKYFTYNNAVSGLRLMMWGMFKKVVIADRLAIITDPVFNAPHSYTATSIFLASVLFSFQIYCDFSGYSDIALGSARVMGFRLMKNFNRPYSSRSVSDFWRHWHISLSTWFKDYLYIPLGGNRVSPLRRNINLFIVFLISGLWHGANWTFIIWGALHGCYIIFATLTIRQRTAMVSAIGLGKVAWLNNLLQQLTTFTLVTIAWIFFRAPTVKTAVYMIGRLPGIFSELWHLLRQHASSLNLPVSAGKLLLAVGFIALLEAIHFMERKRSFTIYLQQQPRPVRWAVYYVFVFLIVYLGVFEHREFIYFQF